MDSKAVILQNAQPALGKYQNSLKTTYLFVGSLGLKIILVACRNLIIGLSLVIP
jgi:hypothetical protein